MFLEKDFASMIDFLTDRVHMPQSELAVTQATSGIQSQIYRYWSFEVPHIPVEDEGKARQTTGSLVMDNQLIDFSETSSSFKVTVRNY